MLQEVIQEVNLCLCVQVSFAQNREVELWKRDEARPSGKQQLPERIEMLELPVYYFVFWHIDCVKQAFLSSDGLGAKHVVVHELDILFKVFHDIDLDLWQ